MAKTNINLSARGTTKTSGDFMIYMGVILMIVGLPVALFSCLGVALMVSGAILIGAGILAHFTSLGY